MIGATWSRLFPENIKGYGFIDSHTPELSISILPKYIGYGAGSKLLKEILLALKKKGYSKVSLAVQKKIRL
ncbi:GNAT family N-acetyltransferase [Miniphocaeibacter halophilus]|uniref:GNAT family N-acetyltransferase n=1 Tax=Miniphocaeibacter halophilus TaxID=2931922 RepID=A0AC61N3S7_9FIRM|nr:GNAT family N-acetyltransferase [Miniphocaeibacter halophilus]